MNPGPRGRGRGARQDEQNPNRGGNGRGGRGSSRGATVPRPAEPGPSHAQPQSRPLQQQQPQPAGRAAQSAGRAAQSDVSRTDRVAVTGRGGNRANAPAMQSLVRTVPTGYENKSGFTGNKVNVVTNYFKLLTRPKWSIYQYRVDFSPEEDSTMVRRGLLKHHKNVLQGYIFDGTTLYTPFRLTSDPLTLCSKKKSDDSTVNITLKHVGEVGYGDYVYLQVYNIIMRKCYSTLKLKLMGRDFFDPAAKIDIREHKIQVWPGYKTTISQYDAGIFMVAEIAHKIVRTDNVLENLRIYKQQYGDNYKFNFAGDFQGQIVLAAYSDKTYRIDDIDWNARPTNTFPKNGENISYVDYYYQKYQLRVTDLNQPLLVSRAKPRDLRRGMAETLYLIPEFCQPTGLTNKMRADFNLMRSIADHTRISPEVRAQKLKAFNKRLLTSQECCQELQQWDMTLGNELINLTGRELPQENIISGEEKRFYKAGDTNDGWTRELRSHPMVSSAKVNSWVVITMQRLRNDTENFVRSMIQAARGMNWNLPQPQIVDIPSDAVGTYMSAIERVLSQQTPSLLFCVTFSNKSELYNAIKKKCCADRAIPTQIVVSRTIRHKSAFSIATKVVIQMNCKLGGAPWAVRIPMAGLMVIGYDVCHDPKNRNRSYGAMVASLDRFHTKYFNCISQHTNGEELAHEFGLNIRKALMKYKEVNGDLPTAIVIYRDGVGEGQIPYVYNHEVEVIKKTLDEIYQGCEKTYKMQFTIVSKRINTRFFVNGKNPKPGTVIDNTVTSPERYDFFIVSQAVRDGTVSPTNYNIIYDTTNLKPDHSQLMAYKFCHMYYNFSGQVRVPAPCQYAHKLAFLVSQSVQQPPHQSLNSVLFFL